jgi:hypothetical protein
MAELLVSYLWPEASRVTTRTPYGTVGSYWARRLARTEISAASGRSLINYSAGNPYIDMIAWALSGAHKEYDICDVLAAAGPYPKNAVPLYVPHPHCKCNLRPLVTRRPAEVTEELRRMINAPLQFPQIRRLQGAFNPLWAVAAMLTGAWLIEVLGEESQQNAA